MVSPFDEQKVYNTIYSVTNEDNGFCVSGYENILNLFNGEYTQQDMVDICRRLNYKDGFKAEEQSYHGAPYIQNIWLKHL